MKLNANDIPLMEACEEKAEEAVALGIIKRSQEEEYALHLFETKKETLADPDPLKDILGLDSDYF